jgi:hypothetical protein
MDYTFYSIIHFLLKKGETVKLYSKSISIFLVTIFLSINTSQRTNAPIISTIPEAIIALRKIMINTSAGSDIILQEYEKKYSDTIVVCAKILYDAAYAQILDVLEEIDDRLKYWQYQKNHPWRYFVTKSPVKWVTGTAQNEEINNNIEQLESHQGELYVLLGQLAEYRNAYDHKHKILFKNEYIQAYAWVDGLLDLLVRINVSVNTNEMSLFIARITLLKAKLERVRFFKNQILSDMKETVIPAHLERNWLKYGVATLMFGYGYSNISLKQLEQSLESIKNNITAYIVDPVQNVIKDVFRGGFTEVEGELLIPQENIEAAQESIKKFVNGLSIQADLKQEILKDVDSGKSSSFQLLLDDLIGNSWNPKTLMNYVVGKSLLGQLLGGQAGGRVQKQLADIQKQYVGVGKIAVLTPALLSSWLAYRKYQAMTAKDYTPIRRALIDINSLFVDATKPLDDEQYGKMLYLVYDLKKRAAQDVPLTDRVDFINDLHRVESKEFNVAAKRAIVDDMFRKYSFLRLS